MAGRLQSCTYALPVGWFYLQHLYRAIIRVPHLAITEVKTYWLHLSYRTVERAWFTLRSSVIITIDACTRGWGVWHHCMSSMLCEVYLALHVIVAYAQQLPRVERYLHGSYLLQVLPDLFAYFCKNMTAVHLIYKLYTYVQSCAAAIWHLLTYALGMTAPLRHTTCLACRTMC